jgi:tRNA modification GTPase
MANYILHDLKDTIVALATPPGVGAIGVIRLSGKEAIDIVDKCFPSKDLHEQPSHTIHFGPIRDRDDHLLDEVLVSLFVAPKSYTGEDVVEVSCHGSPFIIQKLIQLFIDRGARLAQPGEFTLRAFLNGKMDLSQAEAVADLIASSTEAAHAVALRQMRGGFSDEIAALRQELIDFASLIELELDFAEEDVEFANRDELKKLIYKIQGLLRRLIDSFQLGNAIKNGVNTVIAGRPNAGKSTLLNALLNEERAIVSEIAGTTRDTIEEVLNIRGIPFRIIDTAGIRDAEDAIESIGVARTLEKVRQSSVLVYVFDVIATQPADLRADLAKLAQPGVHVIVAANKMDLNPYTSREHYFEVGNAKWEVGNRPAAAEALAGKKSEMRKGKSEPGEKNVEADHQPSTTEAEPGAPSHFQLPASHFDWVPLSALNNMNIEYLKDKLYEAVVNDKLNLESTVVSNVRHYDALQRAHRALDDVLKGMDAGVTSDFVAMDIRQALHFLGEITGEISTEDLLGNIFGKFCIGK